MTGNDFYVFSCFCRPNDELNSHTVHIDIPKVRRPRSGLKDVEVFGAEIFRMRMAQMGAKMLDSRA